MERITTKKLDYLTDRINEALGISKEPWSVDEDGKLIANVGTFYVGKAYGGYQLERMVSAGGAVSVPVEYRGTARETYLVLKGILEGIQFERESK